VNIQEKRENNLPPCPICGGTEKLGYELYPNIKIVKTIEGTNIDYFNGRFYACLECGYLLTFCKLNKELKNDSNNM